MIPLNDYLIDPCGAAALPFWKEKSMRMPETMRVVHARDLDAALLKEYRDTPYFRLLHDLKNIGKAALPEGYRMRTANAAADIPMLARLINACYETISVTENEVYGFLKRAVYVPELWVVIETREGEPCAAGVAEYDAEAGEGALEWIQVLPAFQRKGLARALVNELLARLSGLARFATVSGEVNNPSSPEALYRACGFAGNDVWHVLTKKKEGSL